MSTQHDLATLAKSGEAQLVSTEKSAYCPMWLAALRTMPDGHNFRTLYDVEHMSDDELAKTPIVGTVLEPLGLALEQAGHAPSATVGDIQKHAADMTKDNVHSLTCYCGLGHAMSKQVAINKVTAHQAGTLVC